MAFGKVTKEVMSNPAITPGAKGLYALLCCYMDKDKTCFPGLSNLAAELNVGESTIKRWFAELKKHKVILRQKRNYKQSYLTTILK